MKRPYKEEALRWLTQAKDEFKDAEELRKSGRLYLALFLFQQATEKALNAYQYLKAGSFEVFRTHSISDLMEMAVEVDPDFKEVINAKKLDKYYVITRYPNGLPGGCLRGFLTIQEKPRRRCVSLKASSS
ncbi:HEPN domain-containing protein [Methanocella conradii]|uniref:HEPN domain-containing protein n=1 Tax=Methanocella conradii TaxID=1175444 RepID=UPI0024B37DB4|nr:HEPN domain-containing protein [Methanocella conradii]MDI6897287.1 HEPN domain-containing protein [Methanocella conradii]